MSFTYYIINHTTKEYITYQLCEGFNYDFIVYCLAFNWHGNELQTSSDIDDGNEFRYEPLIIDKDGKYTDVTDEMIKNYLKE